MAADSPVASAADLVHLELPIVGMTCASCAGRVEKRLERLDGVHATVNLALERASITFDPALATPTDLVDAVESIGYHATLPPRPPAEVEHSEALAQAHAHGAGDEHDHGSAGMDRLVVSTLLALPVVLLSMIPALQFRNWQWLALLLTTAVVVWGAAPIHQAALANARHGAATMDTLVSVGIAAAYGWSLWALFFGGAGDAGMEMGFHLTLERSATPDELYLEVAAAVPVFMLLGRELEARAKRGAGAALHTLLDLAPSEATLLDDDGTERTVPAASLRVGQRVVVRPGQRVPTDGVVVEGHAAIDQAAITGESVPVEVGPGDAVIGATIDTDGRLVVEATRVGADTTVAQMGRLVAQAQAGKAAIARLADRVAGVFVPVVLVIAAATLGFWLGAGWPGAAVSAAVAVLVIACPCALGLATPTALLAGSGRGAQMGILIKGPEVLESTRRVDTVVLDKTGTVTTGVMAVVGVHPAAGVGADEALRWAGAVEAASGHPVARALTTAARATLAPGEALGAVGDFRDHAGLGVVATVGGRRVAVGRPAFVADDAGALPPELAEADAEARRTGATVVVVAVDGRSVAVISVADEVKPTSAAAIAGMRRMGLRPVLLTGDNEVTARAVAAAVGIDDVVADVLPAGKVDVVRRLQAEGRVVAMVGDGVNDAPALAQADLGIALGSGTDAAIEASDLTLLRGDLEAVVDAIGLARRTLGTIRGNLFWAFAYNVAAIPLAAAGYLNPLIAGAAMAASSVFVVTNSLRLRRFRRRPAAPSR